ncbi:hypothetical protein V8E53_003986 [Lactarius tabidus]
MANSDPIFVSSVLALVLRGSLSGRLASNVLKREDPLSINDVPDLLPHIIADSSDSPPPSWIKVQSVQLPFSSQVNIYHPFSTAFSHLSHGEPQLSISIPPPLDLLPPKPPGQPSSVDPHPEEAAAMATFHSSHTRFPMVVPPACRDMQYACTPSSIRFSGPLSAAWKKRDAFRAHFWLKRSSHSATPGAVLLTVEQVVENDYPAVPAPSFLADVFQKPEGWMELMQKGLIRSMRLTVKWIADGKVPTWSTSQVGTGIAYAQWLGCIIQDRGPGGHKREEGAHTCLDILNAKPRLRTARVRRILADFEPILVPIAYTLAQSRVEWRTHAHGDRRPWQPGWSSTWHGTSATAPTTTVACAKEVEVLHGLLRVLDSHEFIFGRLTELERIRPKADSLFSGEEAENQILSGKAETKTESSEVPLPPPGSNENVLFGGVTDLTAFHAALPALLISGRTQRPPYAMYDTSKC